ncbi:F-box protein At4g09920-like [Silene latifolia]|uniref:F-box protein At4g09920-like n=1 Tax=Silene latifolia TaxID=37657 RepID=UPI003D76ACAB
MIPVSKKSKTGQFNSKDRFSDLPDFIIHHIISYLGTKEAYRTSVLSKRWTQISATNPVLEFHHYRFSRGTTAALLEYIDIRMQKYSKENFRIKTLTLAFPNSCIEFACKVDEWLGIAARNRVEKFVLTSVADYKLPQILFSARSLRILECTKVEIPYYESIDLASLESLELCDVVIEERMLCHIVKSCLLLKDLRLSDCSGFKSIVIPQCSKLELLDISETLPTDGRVILETSSLKVFCYIPKHSNRANPWPITSKGGLLRNLRFINIATVDITDEVFAKLLPELTSLENLVFWGCHKLTSIIISSTQIKDIRFNDCCSLCDVLIDAPSLINFKFNGELDSSLCITIRSEASCNVSFHTLPVYLDTDGFFKLKKVLAGINNCNVLKLLLLKESIKNNCDDVEFDEEAVRNADLGPPCVIRKLKLTLSSWILSKSSLSALLDGLFWTCHLDIISLRVHLRSYSLTIPDLISKLEDMTKCWRHPLKRVEVEGANCSNLLVLRKLDVQLRLYW